MRIFRISALAQVFTIHGSLAEALADGAQGAPVARADATTG